MTGKENLFDKIKKGVYKFPLNFSTIDKHIISQLLVKEPVRRISINKVLKNLVKYVN
jgi:hypothetical protein